MALRGVTMLMLVGAIPAYSGEGFPRWGMQTFCGDRVASGGAEDCVKVQLEYRDKAKRLWADVEEEDRMDCIEWLEGDDVPPSYFRLENCLSSKRRGGR